MNKLEKKVQVVLFRRTEVGELQVLLLKTCKERGEFWQNITGSVESSESFFDAASREIFEESGLRHGVLKELPCENNYTRHDHRQVHEKCFSFIQSDWSEVVLSSEHSDFKWQDVKKISKESYHFESNYEVFKVALNEVMR